MTLCFADRKEPCLAQLLYRRARMDITGRPNFPLVQTNLCFCLSTGSWVITNLVPRSRTTWCTLVHWHRQLAQHRCNFQNVMFTMERSHAPPSSTFLSQSRTQFWRFVRHRSSETCLFVYRSLGVLSQFHLSRVFSVINFRLTNLMLPPLFLPPRLHTGMTTDVK